MTGTSGKVTDVIRPGPAESLQEQQEKKQKEGRGSGAGSNEIRENKGEKVQPGQRSVFPGLHHRPYRDDWYRPCIANLLGKHGRDSPSGKSSPSRKPDDLFQATEARLEEMQEGGGPHAATGSMSGRSLKNSHQLTGRGDR